VLQCAAVYLRQGWAAVASVVLEARHLQELPEAQAERKEMMAATHKRFWIGYMLYAVWVLLLFFGCSTAHRERVETWMVEQLYPCMYEHTWLGGNYDECMRRWEGGR
jgi:hypothetical protein